MKVTLRIEGLGQGRSQARLSALSDRLVADARRRAEAGRQPNAEAVEGGARNDRQGE